MTKVRLLGWDGDETDDPAKGPKRISKEIEWPATMLVPRIGEFLRFKGNDHLVDSIFHPLGEEISEIHFKGMRFELKSLVDQEGFQVEAA
jgi:hypothetical protein